MLPTTLPIGALRELGVKVSTVFYDHDPQRGLFHYSLRMPDALGDLRTQYDGKPIFMPNRRARAFLPALSDGHHLIIKGDDAQTVADLLVLVRVSLEVSLQDDLGDGS